MFGLRRQQEGAVAKRSSSRPSSKEVEATRKYLSQADVPGHSLAQALRVPQAIADNYGKNPTKTLRVAEALDMSPG